MHIHIALVGGQPIPVVRGIQYFHPDKVILVCSNETIGQAVTIQKYFKDTDAPSPIFDEVIQLDDKDVGAAFSKAQKCALKYKDTSDEITLNLSGGLKSWSIAFYEAFNLVKNALCFYIDQGNRLTNLRDQKMQELPFEFSIDEYVRIQKTHIIQSVNFTAITGEDKKVATEFMSLCSLFKNRKTRDDYRRLTNDSRDLLKSLIKGDKDFIHQNIFDSQNFLPSGYRI